ncbi:MAG: ribosome silencing factor [Deltaproteobacteria bacterium]|jgi:ribosome-associated protein|nr:ribosome silencing factor [Deltaproteobacteria bacterium]
MKTPRKSTLGTSAKVEQLCAWLEEKKARELVALDLTSIKNINFITDAIIVAGASSLRHARGLADFVLEQAKIENFEFFQMEGYKNGLWVLLDFNDIILNIFQDEQRDLYRLEDLYPGAAVMRDDRMK